MHLFHQQFLVNRKVRLQLSVGGRIEHISKGITWERFICLTIYLFYSSIILQSQHSFNVIGILCEDKSLNIVQCFSVTKHYIAMKSPVQMGSKHCKLKIQNKFMNSLGVQVFFSKWWLKTIFCCKNHPYFHVHHGLSQLYLLNLPERTYGQPRNTLDSCSITDYFS